MSDERVCVLCEHWVFDSGEPAWSPDTPGYEWESWCRKDKWHVQGHIVTQDGFREKLLTALTCEEFAPARRPSDE